MVFRHTIKFPLKKNPVFRFTRISTENTSIDISCKKGISTPFANKFRSAKLIGKITKLYIIMNSRRIFHINKIVLNGLKTGKLNKFLL